MEAISFVCSEAEASRRLDQVLVARVPGMSRARARELAAEGKVRLNGRRAPKGARVAAGDRVDLEEGPRPTDFLPDPDPELELVVIHEDADLLVVDKPAGVACHPLEPEERGTVVQALLARWPELGGVGYARRESGLVHRLDVDTSGLLLVARSAGAFEAMVRTLREGRIDKRYRALTAGEVAAPRTIDLPIARHPSDARRVVACSDERAIGRLGAKPAITEVLASTAVGGFSLVEVRARSARRHQVRVHLAAIGHPLVGDRLYEGPVVAGFERHFLHASSLRFTHPRTGVPLELEAPLSPDLEAVLDSHRT